MGIPHLCSKAIRQFGKSVIVWQLVTGERRWYIVRCYLAPGDGTTFRDVEAAIAERQRGAELIVAGEFSMGLEKTGRRGKEK